MHQLILQSCGYEFLVRVYIYAPNVWAGNEHCCCRSLSEAIHTKKFDLKEVHNEFEHQPTRVAVLDALEAGESSCCSVVAGSNKVLHVNCGFSNLC